MNSVITGILNDRPDITREPGDDVAALARKALGLANEIGRAVAQASWTLRYHEEDRDELMKLDVDELVRQAMGIPWWRIYPELSHQVDGVLRDSFDDEHFKLEDPAGWAENNEDEPIQDGSARVLH